MTATVIFRPQAAREAGEALRWYEEQQPGLGARFLDALEDTIERVAANPAGYARIHGEIRRAILRRFPYAVYFRSQGSRIIIIAVLHAHRHARRWQSRR